MSIRTTLMTFLFCLPLAVAAQEENYATWDELRVNPAQYSEIHLDCQSTDCNEVLSNLDVFSNLNAISLHRIASHKPFSSFKIPKKFSLEVRESPELDIKKFLKKVSNEEALTELKLIENELRELPSNLSRFVNLTDLECSGNQVLELTNNQDVLNDLDRLTSLTWKRNDASFLPAWLNFYSRLKYLDISENGMVEFPIVRPNPLRNLTYLDISDNIILDLEESIKNLGMRVIKEIHLDADGLEARDVRNIEKLHSKARFYFTNLDTVVVIEEDSLLKALEEKEQVAEEKYGKLSASKSGTKILSPSYLYYPEIFQHGKFKYTFDTTSFEGRYKSLRYENVRPLLPMREYSNLALSITPKPIKGELWFEWAIITYDWLWGAGSNSEMRRYMNRYNKEMNAFRNMVFVLEGDMSKKEFKKKFVKDKYYTDFRLYYDESAGSFTLELKDLQGFQELKVYLRYKNKNYGLEKSQETYTRRYARYMRSLDVRKRRFHKKMLSNKAGYDRQYFKTTEQAWKDFSKLYFSEEEKAMTREEWLKYYDKVVANELRAMDNADISLDNLTTSLKMGGYMEVSYADLITRQLGSESYNVIFTDEKGNRLPITQYAIIDRKDKLFVLLTGGLGQGENIMLKGFNHRDFEVIGEMRNGDMGVTKAASYRKFELSQKDLEKLEVEVYDHKLSHIGLFWDRIEF